ncbi:MAG: hypothetical protein HC862_26510 [Scytonema sp. RU_4_4]|nr:hypothetical protein [Scytonema sp. RU_4_4]
MTKPVPTRYRNPCLICGDTKGKCRETPTTLLCMNVVDRHSAPGGFKFLGLSRDGLWGKFIEDKGHESKEKSQEWRQLQAQKKRQRELEEKERRARLLTESERDRESRKLLAQLPVSTNHRNDLQRRGLSDELIARGMFKSVVAWQPLDFEVSWRLAGVSSSGKSLTNAQSGYMCPIWNPQGQIVAWQLRCDVTSVDDAKYKWASSASKWRPNGPTSHLPNGELPLTYCVPTFDINTTNPLAEYIGLAEGILKPWIVAQIRQHVVIGAAGGNHAGSEQTLRYYVDEASQCLGGTKKALLYADAGAIANRHVMRAYRRTYKLLLRWGYTLRVAWWGQIDKNCADPDEYKGNFEIITWAQFESLSHSTSSFWDNLKVSFAKLGKFLGTVKKFDNKAPHHPQQPLLASAVAKLDYVPGNLPTPEEYIALGMPRIVYSDGQRAAVWQEAVAKGWKHILDKSAPGLGKSHTVGLMKVSDFGMRQLWYLATDHRNPTTALVEENYVDLPVRHSGLFEDLSRLTPLGKPYLVRSAENAQKTQANCFRESLFRLLTAKNMTNIEARDSPICLSCHLLHACRATTGAGYGFRYLRALALQQCQLRAHPDSLPNVDDYDWKSCGLFWDEASQIIKNRAVVRATKADFDRTVGEIALKFPELMQPLQPVFSVLRSLFWGKVYGEQPLPILSGLMESRYGLDDAAIRSALGKFPDNLMKVITDLESKLFLDLHFLKEPPDSVDLKRTDKAVKASAKLAGKIMRAEGYGKQLAQLESLALNWFVPFLKIWAGLERGSLRFEAGTLSVHMCSYRHVKVAHDAAFNVYLDGTANVDYLALKLGVQSSEILVVEQQLPDYNNLRVVHVTDMGVLGKDRRESVLARLAALRQGLNKLHENIQYIERKSFAVAGDGYHFRDGRGVNRFKDIDVFCSVGIPYPNIGDLAAEYQILTGISVCLAKKAGDGASSEEETAALSQVELAQEAGFKNFVDTIVQAEILQEAARLRPHLRPQQQLVYYFVGDYDIRFMNEAMPGVQVEEMAAVTIAPQAGTQKQRTLWTITHAVDQVLKLREKLTQDAIAKLSDVSQGRISQIAKDFGGWQSFKKLLVSLVEGFASRTTDVKHVESNDDMMWLQNVYLPLLVTEDTDSLEVVTEVVKVAQVFGWQSFQVCYGNSLPAVQAQLLFHLLAVLPEKVRDWFVDIVEEVFIEDSS